MTKSRITVTRTATMPKFGVLIALFCLFTPFAYGNVLEGIVGLTAYKKEVQNTIAQQNNSYKAELGVVKDNYTNLLGRLEKIEVSAEVQVSAVAGVKNDVKNLSVGRDNININDTGLLTEIFKGLFALMTAVCVGLFTALKAKEKHIQALIASNQKKQDKQDIWERDMINRLSFGNKEADRLLKEAEGR